jgi:hypothetical protein
VTAVARTHDAPTMRPTRRFATTLSSLTAGKGPVKTQKSRPAEPRLSHVSGPDPIASLSWLTCSSSRTTRRSVRQ